MGMDNKMPAPYFRKLQEIQDFHWLWWYNRSMKNSTISTDELNQLPKGMLVILYTNLNESFRILSEQNSMIQKQNEQLIHQVEGLKEQLAALTQHRFGPRSERDLQTGGQLSIDLETMCILNEVECLVGEGLPEEAAMEGAL